MKSWSPFEMKLFRELKLLPRAFLEGKNVYLGLSGGADSVALALSLKALSSALHFKLSALHCHHGVHENLEFRDESQQFVVDFCQHEDLVLKIFKNENMDLKSEDSLREFRRAAMFSALGNEDVLALAHHGDDLFETRLLRLIRGSGGGGLEAMSLFQSPILRPFLNFSRSEIEEYLEHKKQKFMLDPSRGDLRSFLRHNWLPALEKRSPGACKAFARSLEVISLTICNYEIKTAREGDFIDHAYFLTLNKSEQERRIASYISSLKIKNFSRAQIQEIIKNLDKSQNVHTFKVAGLKWDIDAKKIRATPCKR